MAVEAPASGTVTEVFVEAGAVVQENDLLLVID
jgi:biotin carboxyl carrier protein